MKRKLDESSIEGYVVEVGTVLTSKVTGVKYFDGKFQSNKEVVRFVNFSPERLDQYSTAYVMKSPVKLLNAKITPKQGTNEIVLGRHSAIEVCQRKLDFNMTELPKIECNLTAKVVLKDTVAKKPTKFGPRDFCKTFIGDATGQLELPLWGNKTKEVQQGKSYRFTNMCSRLFGDSLQVGTTATTVISPVDDLMKDIPEVKNETLKSVDGPVVVANYIKMYKCLQCFKSLNVDDESIQKIQCQSCFAKQKLSHASQSSFAKIQVKNSEGELVRFIVPSATLKACLEANNIREINEDIVCDFFLDCDKVSVDFKEGSDNAVMITKLS